MVFFFFFFMFVVSVHQKNRKIRFKLILLPFLIIGFCLYRVWLHIVRLVNLSGDVEKNSGPKSYSAQYLAICHWNLNSIAAHNFTKIALLKAYLSVHKNILYAFLKYFLILLSQLMMIICKFLGTAPLELTIRQILNVVEFCYTIKVFYQ